MNGADETINRVLNKLTYLGLAMNVGAPVAAFVIVTLALGKDIHAGGGLPFAGAGQSAMLFYVFLAVAVGDLVAAYVIRRVMPRSMAGSSAGTPTERFERGATTAGIIIYALNLSATIYGVVLAILGANAQTMMLFVALTLIGYQLLRFRRGYLEDWYDRLHPDDSGGARRLA